jgi:hypothetical protein
MTPTPTPGSYPLTTILSSDKSGDKFVIITNQGNLYAMTYDPQAARMIQAGPEMLECLTAMAELLTHNNGRATSDLNGWADKARKAIQKANGEA